MSFFKLAACCLTTLLSLGSLTAQTIRFIPLNDEVAATKIGVQDAKGITNLKDLNSQKRSIAYKCKPGKTPLKLVAMDRPDAAGKPTTVEILVPKSIKVPLVLILTDPDHASGLRTITLEDSSAGFTWGCLRFINVTPGALMVRCGAELIPLPEGNTPTDILPGGDARNIGVQLFKEDAQDKILFSGVWEHAPNNRKLVVVTQGADPTVGELTLLIVPESKPAGK